MRLLACRLFVSVATPALAAGADSCEATLAATRNFRNGAPADALPLPDGSGAVFLRSGPRDTKQAIWRFDLADGRAHAVALPDAVLAGPETLSVAERARRERTRTVTTGFADFDLARDGTRLATLLDGRLVVADVRGGAAPRVLAGTGWLTPHLSPDGRLLAAVRDDDVHVVDLATGADTAVTTGGTDVHPHGLAEFAAEEELDRFDGFWWSPDGATLLVEDSDSSGVDTHTIADPADPEQAPVTFRYPRAGTANAVVRLELVGRHGGPARPVQWDSTGFPYLARVVWPAHGALSLVVLDRAQKNERVLAVDPATGATRTLLAEHDPAWIDITPFPGRHDLAPLPHWLADGSGFLWANDAHGEWRLEMHRADGTLDHVVTPAGFRYEALGGVDGPDAVVAGGTDPESSLLYRIPLAGGRAVPLAAARGLHDATFGTGPSVFADSEDLADGTSDTVLRDARTGRRLATLPSVAEKPAALPRLEWTEAAGFDAVLLHPHGWHRGERLPVVLSAYGGPTVKVVRAAARLFLPEQCLADRGAIVVSLDGRGTPGHGRDFDRATLGDLLGGPIADQVAGLQALGRAHPAMDMRRVAVTGWSFGGTFSAAATMRRPDVFAAGVAGAPVTDFRNYDTAYTERYLGEPQADPAGYDRSAVLPDAPRLRRPLMIVHGLTDDNVYFVNTFELTQALLRAHKPYRLVLLPGTHLLADPTLRADEAEAVDGFLHDTIGLGTDRSRAR